MALKHHDSIKIAALVVGLVLAWAGPVTAGDPVLYTNRDLPPLPTSGDPGVATSTKPTEATPPALPPLTYATFTDRNGHGEAWWRDRVAKHRVAVAEAEEELQSTYQMLRWIRPRNALACRPRRGDFAFLTARENYLAAQTRVDELAKQWELLLEEARTSDALPGWFQEDRLGLLPDRG